MEGLRVRLLTGAQMYDGQGVPQVVGVIEPASGNGQARRARLLFSADMRDIRAILSVP